MLRIASQLGATAVGLCARKLECASEGQAHWAYTLLDTIARDDSVRPRVVSALRVIAETSAASDDRKVLALALLTELGETLPTIRLRDLDGAHEQSMRELARCLVSPATVARAVDLLLARLDVEELIRLLESMSATDSQRAATILDEILLRDDISGDCRDELRRLRAPLPEASRTLTPARSRTDLVLGSGPSGAQVLIAVRRRRGSRPLRKRALCCSISDRGVLVDALYGDDFTPRGVDREVIRPLEGDGYVFAEIAARQAAELLTEAARATLQGGQGLPSAYYLGRDLFGLYDEHQLPRAVEHVHAPLLARAIDLLADEDFAEALPLLEKFVVEVPEIADGWANLGLCHLRGGELTRACLHLGRAARLEADNPLHHWNLAAASHRSGRLGGCYLALLDYLDNCAADPSTSEEQRKVALDLIAEYERFSALEFPAVDARALARAEELGHRAHEDCDTGGVDDKVAALEQAVRIAPSHYPSWSELGTAYAERDCLADAQRCLERALSLRPGLDDAREVLAEVVERRAQQPHSRRRRSKRAALQRSDR